MEVFVLLVSILSLTTVQSANPKFAPYFDVTLGQPSLMDVYQRTGQKDYTLAFVLGGTEGCVPTWASQFDITDARILDPIKEMQRLGGEMIIATGGALGNYLEHRCTTVQSLVDAYKRALDVVGTTHLDIDIEAPINNDLVNQALAQVQRERPDVSVSYTLMVQGDDYGVTPSLGVDVLVNAKRNGVRVDLVNIMAMEFPSRLPSWGDAVIGAAESTILQLKEIWPEKSDAEVKRMLGVTPMIGRNFNGKKFETSHGRQLVAWANQNQISFLSYWSIARDNGDCRDTISPICSGAEQGLYEFAEIFRGFN